MHGRCVKIADNKQIDNGALTDFTAATDEIGGVDYQYVKLVDGTADSTTKVGADANGLWVNVKTITAGSKLILTDGTSDATVRNLAANHALNVAIVDGSGAQVTSFAGSGGSSATDGSAFTPDTTAATTVMGLYQASPSTMTSGDVGAAGITANREWKMSLTSSALDVAHDAADSGDPALIGMRAQSALPASVANNDRARAISDVKGRQLIAHYIDQAEQTWKNFNATTTQTGAIIWNPAAGKKIAITHFTIGSYGTTSARLIMYFGADADTTYDGGTDQLVFAASFAPSTTSKPGAVVCPPVPIFAATADHSLHITTDAAMSVDVAVYGFEYTP